VNTSRKRRRRDVDIRSAAAAHSSNRNFHASNWLFAQTTHVDVAHDILYAGSCPGGSYIFQVSWKSVEGSRSCWGEVNWLGSLLTSSCTISYKPWIGYIISGWGRKYFVKNMSVLSIFMWQRDLWVQPIQSMPYVLECSVDGYLFNSSTPIHKASLPILALSSSNAPLLNLSATYPFLALPACCFTESELTIFCSWQTRWSLGCSTRHERHTDIHSPEHILIPVQCTLPHY